MRDVIITIIVFGSLPFIFRHPYIGVLMWVWISVMNPHRLSYGFAYSFPFAAVIAAVTLLSLLMTKQEKKLPMTPVVTALILFSCWMSVTTAFALWPSESFVMLQRVLKTMLMTLVAIMLIKTREQLYFLIWALVISLCYYGIKGGIFTVLGGGHSTVWGPEGSYIEGNNELALALITIIPMVYCLFLNSHNKWVRRGMAAAMVLCGLSALGSYSRGALLGIGGMVLFLWMKSSRKALMGGVIVLLLPAGILFMPDKWSSRMETINTYKSDASAMGRINAWHMAFNLSMDRPFVGGGFEIYNRETFARWAPVPEDVHAAHSIYFQGLGEHGWVGLGLYLLLALHTWRKGAWIVRVAAKSDNYKWAANIATMIQVSMIGFATGGAFLSLLYYDVPYYLIAVMASLGEVVEKMLKEEENAAKTASQPPQQLAS